MKIPKRARHEAKQLFLSCRIDGRLDEVRVRQITSAIIQHKPRSYLAILTHFKRLVQLELESRTARVVSLSPLTEIQRIAFQQNLLSTYGPGLQFSFSVDPALIGGARVQVGSDVYDGSIEARLNVLRESF